MLYTAPSHLVCLSLSSNLRSTPVIDSICLPAQSMMQWLDHKGLSAWKRTSETNLTSNNSTHVTDDDCFRVQFGIESSGIGQTNYRCNQLHNHPYNIRHNHVIHTCQSAKEKWTS